MPPAFNLSQDQTLQFNLCGWHFCLTLSSPLTQNTDRAACFQAVLYFFVSTSMFKVSSSPKQTGAVPSSAHTYRLLIVKELFVALRSLRLRLLRRFAYFTLCCQIVLFVSSRETRLCSFFPNPSTTLFSFSSKTWQPRLLYYPCFTTCIPSSFLLVSYSSHPLFAACFSTVSRREPNYSKPSQTLATPF